MFGPAFTNAVQGFLYGVGVFFILYLIGYATFLFLSVSVGASTLYRAKRDARYRNVLDMDCYVPVSILVPAHNEGITIVNSVRSLTSLDYHLFEIVVVDDGSGDDTSQRLIDAFGLQRIERPVHMRLACAPIEEVWTGEYKRIPITLVRKRNGGKADALNAGINLSRYPYFICMDADSALQRDSLARIVAPVVENDDVIAVGGLVRPSNGIAIKDGVVQGHALPAKIIPAMQVLEYDRSFLSARILFDHFNGNLIISGAFGLFRKDVVIAAGGYDPTTVGEDMELVSRLHVFCRANAIPYAIRYAPDAICWSQAPETLADLRKQRKRWQVGLFESMTRNGRLFANHRFGPVAYVSYTYYLIYELLSPFIELFGLATVALALALHLINVSFMIFFFILYALFGAVLSLTAFFSRALTRDLRLTAHDALRALSLAFIEITVLRFILAVTRMGALIGYHKRGRTWERVSRSELDAS